MAFVSGGAVAGDDLKCILHTEFGLQAVEDIECRGVHGMDVAAAEIAEEVIDLLKRCRDIVPAIMIDNGKVLPGVRVIEIQLALLPGCVCRYPGKHDGQCDEYQQPDYRTAVACVFSEGCNPDGGLGYSQVPGYLVHGQFFRRNNEYKSTIPAGQGGIPDSSVAAVLPHRGYRRQCGDLCAVIASPYGPTA